MAKTKQKYYVVWKGLNPGIYHSWSECQLQIKGYPGAEYKAFPSLSEAREAFNQPSLIFPQAPGPSKAMQFSGPEDSEYLVVDAACSGNPGEMEYQGIEFPSGRQVFHQGPYPQGTNNIGEYLAIIHALAWCHQRGLHQKVIYSDSKVAMGWVLKKQPKTTLIKNARTIDLLELMERGTNWLKTHHYSNPLKLWETEKWGENPADFGRK